MATLSGFNGWLLSTVNYLAAMSDYLNIADFLSPIDRNVISQDAGYREGQIGREVTVYEEGFPDLEGAHLVLVGCGEQRGSGLITESGAADEVRAAFYALYHWHHDIKIADVGNIRIGKSVADTYAALKLVIGELNDAGKMVVILGGSHDLTLAQYYAFADKKKAIDAAGVDAIIDINLDSANRSDHFLMELLTAEPNYMNHYNHLAFQSYFVHPRMLETMDKLRFDCFRVGVVKEHIDEMEPVLRGCSIFSFDVTAIAHAFAPANVVTPNGLNGEEACTLMQYAGMSNNMRSIGLYGFQPENDRDALTAKQLAQMLWYLMDGLSRGAREVPLEERASYNEFNTVFAEVETVFLQSKKTGRWWLQLPDGQWIACSHRDYLLASSNQIPERWLRAQERP
ncbi:MAG TPA: formimidoylglutamase [Chitinophagaceae bacterium]|nr:formimidoylglutamase [Chitinophagaceae bacterium]